MLKFLKNLFKSRRIYAIPTHQVLEYKEGDKVIYKLGNENHECTGENMSRFMEAIKEVNETGSRMFVNIPFSITILREKKKTKGRKK